MEPVRNLVVFAPAGSGKTERLSNRYIELLQAGVEPGRILTLTFTEKAAAEMKERIFRRLEERDPKLHQALRRDALKMRVSTIHAFCLELVRRFAPALGLDPRIEVLPDPSEQWQAAKYDTLMAIAESERAAAPADRDTEAFDLLLELITGKDRPGWPELARLYDEFFHKRVKISRGIVKPVDRVLLGKARDELRAHPLCAELEDLDTLLPQEFSPAQVNAAVQSIEAQREGRLTRDGGPWKKSQDDDHRVRNQLLAGYYSLLRQDQYAAEFARRFELFSTRFLAAYTRAKRAAGQVDYDDMESLALQLLETEPDWQNVLRAFDEHTDHLLVDEFQDTSFLQWGIIDKLTEEWRSGEGVKQARNVEPTVFLVGDDKQSIYMFRDAKVEVFRTAADKLREWLGPGKLSELTLEDNYRSLGAIIDFTNALFSRLMSPTGPTGLTGPTGSIPSPSQGEGEGEGARP
ncbi:UvrD-helicase domain-containing protein, partial [candidate division WOR-3 bacterium]|nr:UvrD-helicase domain-containing protein [candidate division WOR-3 bacterium]